MLTKDERAEWVKRGFKDPHKAFANHVYGAASRGIPFEMTFEEWWGIWEPHYEQRGRGGEKLVMCRTGDKGPYAVGNVRIDTGKANVQEGARVRLSDYREASGGTSEQWMWARGRSFAQYSEDENGEPIWENPSHMG